MNKQTSKKVVEFLLRAMADHEIANAMREHAMGRGRADLPVELLKKEWDRRGMFLQAL